MAAILTTFAVCGLWHGANWTFVAWGSLHGVALAVHRVWKLRRPLKALARHRLFRFVAVPSARLVTLALVLVGWVVFESDSLDAAAVFLGPIAAWESGGTRLLSPYIPTASLAVLLAHLPINKDANWAVEIGRRPVPVRLLTYASLVAVLVSLSATDAAPFIYSQF